MNKKIVAMICVIATLLTMIFTSCTNEKNLKWNTSLAESEVIKINDGNFSKISTYDEACDRAYDEEGNIICCNEVPYYGFIDRNTTLDYSEDLRWDYNNVDMDTMDNEIKNLIKTYRTASDNEDFLIVDYKNGVAIVKYQGDDKKVVIPATLDGKPVIKLTYYYYKDEDYFFSALAMQNVKKVYLPTNLKYIEYASLNNIKVEVSPNNPYYTCVDGVLYNKDKTVLLNIQKNNTEEVLKIPQGVKTLYKIVGKKTKKVLIPSSVESIKSLDDTKYWFTDDLELHYYCPFNFSDTIIESIEVDSNNKYYTSEDGVLYNKDKTTLMLYPSRKRDKDFTVPDTVKKICEFCFNDMKYLKTITFGKNIEKINAGFYLDYDASYETPPKISLTTVKGYKGTVAEKWINKYIEDDWDNDYNFRFIALND